MSIELADESSFGLASLRGSNGLTIQVLPDGATYSIECDGVLINQVLASPLAGGISRLYLRAHHGSEVHFAEVIGPRANSGFNIHSDRVVSSGSWDGFEYRCTLWSHPTGAGWFVHVEIENQSSKPVDCDAVFVQDIALATRGQVRNNELFTSQYLDHTAIEHSERGYVLMSRQNLPQKDGLHPWLLQGCFPKARGFTTEGLDLFGAGHRAGNRPIALARKLIGTRVRQYETAYTAVQSELAALKTGEKGEWTFFWHYLPNHPESSSTADLQRLATVDAMRLDLEAALAKPSASTSRLERRANIFRCYEDFHADGFDQRELDEHFPERRHKETLDGAVASFFTGQDARHVVTKAKELRVERPHGHIMRAGRGMTPDAPLMCCTCFAAGVFASQVTLGNTSIGQFISRPRDPLNLIKSGGMRIFIRFDGSSSWQLLNVPSAFEMASDSCRWYYKTGRQLLRVTSKASQAEPALAFEIESSARVEILLCAEIAAGPAEYESRPQLLIDHGRKRITLRAQADSLLGRKEPGIAMHIEPSDPQAIAEIGGDELLFEDKFSRRLPYFAIRSTPQTSFGWTIRGELPRRDETTYEPIDSNIRIELPDHCQALQLQDTLSWFAHDAMIHLSTPRGLDQTNGGAWGVRDVCQGSVEFLLSYDRGDVVADILRKVFAQQYDDQGDWPQWFMFPPFQEIQASECHGDVPIWPLKALCDYLEHTHDGSILHEKLPYTDRGTFRRTERVETILEHTDRLIEALRREFLPGLSLPRFGEGDWDDSLQPADPELRQRMVSSWTTELLYQTFRRFAVRLDRFGESARAKRVNQLADDIAADFHRHLMPDGVVAGFAIFDGGRPVEYLLHPSDRRTGVKYRLIPMTRGILSELFSTAQANQHLDLIKQHLLYPDGARLMDRPTTYRGGEQQTCRRSETAAFFGREIGLQYVHAHLRYVEALAMMGRGDELWNALRIVNPIACTELVPNGRPRQRNCYFSSSDAAFPTRYDASRDYAKLRDGQIPTEGGWRVYSSGPGIYTSLVIRYLFGIRRFEQGYEFDPVLPRAWDGAACEVQQSGKIVRYQFGLSSQGARLVVNGVPIKHLNRLSSPYRRPAILVPRRNLDRLLDRPRNLVELCVIPVGDK
jgi:cellobiose phosphorylase